MTLLNRLIPGFEERAKAADNLNSFCAPVRFTACFIYAGQPDMKSSCKQVPMMHAAMIRAGSKLQSQIGSTTVRVQTQVYLLGPASLPTGRRNVASPMTLQDASFARSIMIGTTQSTLLVTYSHIFDSLNPSSRVRANLRDGAPGYNYTCGWFLHCLYLGEVGDAMDPSEGFLKGPLLVRVSSLASVITRLDAWLMGFVRHSVISSHLHHQPLKRTRYLTSRLGDAMSPTLFT
jgi:hypothetical protein